MTLPCRARHGRWARLAAAGLLALLAAPARAQLLDQVLPAEIYGVGVEPDVTVRSRVRPEYDNGGVRLGTFVLRPRLSEAAGYESNVLARSSAVGSSVVRTSGSVDARSDGSRSSVAVRGAVDDKRYPELAGQSYTDWGLSAGGSYELGRDTASVLLSHNRTYQTQRDLDVPQLASPLAVATDRARLAYRAAFNRLSLTPSVELDRFRYDSGLVGTAIYDQRFRNRVQVTPGVTAAYEFATRRSAVLVVRDTQAAYATGSAGRPKPNRNDVLVLVGVDYDVNGMLRARLLGGYERRSFTAAVYPTVEAPVAELSLIYNPSGLTTLTASLSRRIQDSADTATATVTSTAGLLKLDHELRRNVILGLAGGVTRNDYASGSGASGGGAQTLYVGGASVDYLLNRYAAVGASYDLLARDGRLRTVSFDGFATGSSYVDHRVLLQLKLGL